MNKKEAAEFLEISIKALDRYIGKKRVSFNYVKGPQGNEAQFEQSELERFKAELADRNKPIAVPAVVRDASFAANTFAGLSTLPSSEEGVGKVGNVEKLLVGIDKLVEQLTKQNQQVMFPIAERMTLTIDESAGISGFPVGSIKRAIKEGSLKVVKVGRVRRVRKEDLDAWVNGL